MFFDNLLANNINKVNVYIIDINFVLQNSALFIFDRINLQLDSKLNCMKKFAKISISIFIILFLAMLIFVGGIFVYINTAKSDVVFDKALLEAQNTSIDIYDIDNNKINDISGKKALVRLDELPSFVPQSFVSIEDKDFYKHHGLNYKRIVKAFFNNIKSRSMKEGASTISQQLIKNTHLSNEKTLSRKINEMALSKELERNFSKDEIMETYLNVIYFGSGAYGLENASQIYFGKPATDLKIEESALLAGLIKSPRTYSPILNPENCLKRRNLVLAEMKRDGAISDIEYQIAVKTPISIKKNITRENARNFYEEATLLEAEKILGMTENQIALGVYKIFTYQVNTDQNALHNVITNTDYYDKNEYGNVADGVGIVLDSKTGGVSAFDAKSVYDVVNMKRSPGSAIKPILVYAPALEYGKISPSSVILDEKTSFGTYNPQNVGGIYYGWIDATKSVEKSLNIPAIKIMQITGIENSKKFAEKSGITFDNEDNSYAIALGGLTHGTTVKQLVNSYLPFANNGEFIEAKFVRKICDSKGKVIYENKQEKKQVMNPETAYLMNEMLVSSVKKGTSSRLNVLPFEVAGKTGTVGIKGTNFNSDVWSVGYTTQKIVGVWLGNSTGEKEYRLEGRNNGGTLCTSMVRDTFKNLKLDKTATFEKPNGIVECKIDNTKLEKDHILMLADPETPERYTKIAIFNQKYAPTQYADKYTKESLCVLKGEMKDSKPTLYFETIKNATYKIYRIEEDVRKEIVSFENVCGTQTFVDKNVNDDTTYTYYVEVLQDNEKVIKSNSIKLSTPAKISSIKKIFNNW